ncbi:peptidoglycan-recognition protein SC1a/b-like [Scaptodrosophila lebanonensis]|uniref:Peptidoglycan-recognition protein n=1 Tax=Drosophila lebanonensis TaxID=7225 RepID=A0A6J2U457_DROLE|nr:peptidoglycan-recognition protein SC1a/b-like [Scaptodrosophila lebanonensis]
MVTKVIVVCVLAVLLCGQYTEGVNIISKAQWGGRAPTYRVALGNYLNYAIIHHTAGAYCETFAACSQQMRNVQSYHMDSLGWPDIGYNFLIGGDGNVYEGRGWNSMGAHAAEWNSWSIGISFMGNYNYDTLEPNMISAAKELLQDAVNRGQLSSGYVLYGHRQVSATECPGTHIWNEIRSWTHWSA